MPWKRTVILSSLRGKGFTQEDGKDHFILRLDHAGLTRGIFTKLSRGSGYRDYDDNLLAKMSRQLKVTRAQLDQLIDCSLDGPTYAATLRAQGLIQDPPPKKLDSSRQTLPRGKK